jgi:hypothetical protein
VADYERDLAVQQHEDEPAYQQADSAGLGGILSDLFFSTGSGSRPSRPGGGWSWGGSSGSGGWSSSPPGVFGGTSRRRGGGSVSRPGSGRRGGGGRF